MSTNQDSCARRGEFVELSPVDRTGTWHGSVPGHLLSFLQALAERSPHSTVLAGVVRNGVSLRPDIVKPASS